MNQNRARSAGGMQKVGSQYQTRTVGKRGFTLIELLVVIAILAALFIPANQEQDWWAPAVSGAGDSTLDLRHVQDGVVER